MRYYFKNSPSGFVVDRVISTFAWVMPKRTCVTDYSAWRLTEELELITEIAETASNGKGFSPEKIAKLKKIYEPEHDELMRWSLDVNAGVPWWIQLGELKFQQGISLKMQSAIKDAARQIDTLLSKPSRCIQLLKVLDTALKDTKSLLSVDPGNGFFVSDKLRVPSEPNGELLEGVSFDHALPDIISDKLSKHDIGNGAIPFFSGAINSESANEVVRNKAVFCELPYDGNLILHGLYTHLIQWFILARAVEEKQLSFEGSLTLSDMMAISVDTTYHKSDWSLWVSLFDHGRHYRGDASLHSVVRHFGKPHRLNTTLLFADSLPAVQTWLLLQAWYYPIAELQCMFHDKYNVELPYEFISFAQSFNHLSVNSFRLGFSKEEVAKQLSQNGSNLELNKETGIAYRSSKQDFSVSNFWKQCAPVDTALVLHHDSKTFK